MPPANEAQDSRPAPAAASPSESSAVRPSSFSSAHYLNHHSLAARLPNSPTYVEHEGMRFLIMDAPSESNIDLYLREMKRHSVTDLVRVCDPTYSRRTVEQHGIRVHEMLFPDGDGPSDAIVATWLGIVDRCFHSAPAPAETATGPTIAVHCVAGLGRAPVLVAVALIEAGMSPLDAVAFLRERRRGAINNKQLRYLESYRRRGRAASPRCTLM